MARPQHQSALQRALLPGAVVSLLVLSSLPARWLGLLDGFSRLALAAFTPLSDPTLRVARWLAPATRERVDDERVRLLKDEADRWRLLYNQERERRETAERRLAQFSRAAAVNPAVPVDLLPRRVVGTSSDPTSPMLRVRAGTAAGVTQNTVATAGVDQLVGRVDDVDGATCEIRPITDPASGRLFGKVLLDPDGVVTLGCELLPTGAGTLRGDVESGPPSVEGGGGAEPAVSPGQEVRLSDPAWPGTAQALLVGLVVAVEPDPDLPLRTQIEVRPTVDLRRLGEVTLRIPVEEAAGGVGP